MENCLEIVRTVKPLYQAHYKSLSNKYDKESFTDLIFSLIKQTYEHNNLTFNDLYSLLEESIVRTYSSGAIKTLGELEKVLSLGSVDSSRIPSLSQLMRKTEEPENE